MLPCEIFLNKITINVLALTSMYAQPDKYIFNIHINYQGRRQDFELGGQNVDILANYLLYKK